MVNVTNDVPAGIVTVFGKVTVVRLLVNLMSHPPAGAGPLRVAVPMTVPPPKTDGGFRVTETKASGTSVRTVVWVVVPKVAESVTVCALVTGVVVMLNVAEV